MSDPTNIAITPIPIVIALCIGYLLGSIPFGLIFARMAGLGDIRKIGSGNIGATNVLRSGNKSIAAATLLADALKGAVAVWLCAALLGNIPALFAGFAAFIGHCFPVWLRFKGGKGVATYVGILLAVSWQAFMAFAFAWLTVAFISRYSSLAALIATAFVSIVLWWLDRPYEAILFLTMTILVWVFHHQNISRLIKGAESKIGSKS